jgi:aminopeptidase N
MNLSVRFIVIAFLMAQCAKVAPASSVNDPRMSSYDVQHYDLSVAFDMKTSSFTGSVGIQASVLETMNVFVLSASNETLTIDSVLLEHRVLPFTHTNDHLVCTLPSQIVSGTHFSAKVYYHGISVFKGRYDDGGVFILTESNHPAIVSSSEPNFARRWWVCKDVPSDKATATLIFTVPKNFTAASNGMLTHVEQKNGAATFTWETKYPIATYLVSIAAAHYAQFTQEYVGIHGERMPIQYYVFPEDSANAVIDFQNTSEILRYFATTFGEYPFIKEKFGYAEVVGDATMENQTLCSVQDKLITGTQKSEMTLVHETSHHWWGDCLTPADWHHTWLNEGFATYAEALYREHTKGHEAYEKYIDQWMNVKDGFFAGSVTGTSDTAFWDSFGARVYFKGALALHMLRRVVGDTTFFTIMKNYLNNPKLQYANVRTEDFIAECEHVYGQSLQWFFDEWIFASTDTIDRPTYEYSWTSKQNSSRYDITIRIRQTQASQLTYRMPFSISVGTSDSTYSFPIIDSVATQEFVFSVPTKPTSVDIDKENRVFKSLIKKE